MAPPTLRIRFTRPEASFIIEIGRVETERAWAAIIATITPKPRIACRAANSQKPHSAVTRMPRPTP